MAVLKIARLGHPVLLQPAAPIGDPSDPELHRLVRDMIETLADAGGVGLAAPQVHVPQRLIIFNVPPGRGGPEGDDAGVPLTAVVDPFLEPEIGRASCRERVCPYVLIQVAAGSLKTKTNTK